MYTNKCSSVLISVAVACSLHSVFHVFLFEFFIISSLTRTCHFSNFNVERFSISLPLSLSVRRLLVVSFLNFCVCMLIKISSKLIRNVIFVFDSRRTSCRISLSFFISIQSCRLHQRLLMSNLESSRTDGFQPKSHVFSWILFGVITAPLRRRCASQPKRCVCLSRAERVNREYPKAHLCIATTNVVSCSTSSTWWHVCALLFHC